MSVVTSSGAVILPEAEETGVATSGTFVGVGFCVSLAISCLSTWEAGFGPGAGLKRYWETSSTSIIKANARGKRFSRDGGFGGMLPMLLDIGKSRIEVSAPDHSHPDETGDNGPGATHPSKRPSLVRACRLLPSCIRSRLGDSD